MPRPDEGMIHAWLDGQLPPNEAARVEHLAATDPEWAAAVAEARGLVAAASRILSALDHVPAGVVPAGTSQAAMRRLPWWTKVAAGLVLVAGGSLLVVQRSSSPLVSAVPMSATGPQTAAPQPPPANLPTAAAKDAPQRTASASASRSAASPPTNAAARTATANQTEKRVGGVEALRREERAKGEPDRALAQHASGRARDAQVAEAATERTMAKAPVPPAVAAKTATNVTPSPLPDITASRLETPAMRVVGGAATAEQMQAQKRVAGAMGAAAPAARRMSCYQVRDSDAAITTGVVMRVARMDGDTLRLEPAQGKSTLRAWIVWRDGAGHGTMSPNPDGRGAVPVVALPVTCPVP